ncbi:unnamed protein product [Amoebophrya sp. A25]|nr:unnamed protein product [Amoebophrya sp. A25]|eukprot:GSA25T00018089001.1
MITLHSPRVFLCLGWIPLSEVDKLERAIREQRKHVPSLGVLRPHIEQAASEAARSSLTSFTENFIKSLALQVVQVVKSDGSGGAKHKANKAPQQTQRSPDPSAGSGSSWWWNYPPAGGYRGGPSPRGVSQNILPVPTFGHYNQQLNAAAKTKGKFGSKDSGANPSAKG